MVTPIWTGSIFPMTNRPEVEPFKTKEDVIRYLENELQDPDENNFYYGVHYETKNWSRVVRAWNGEIMLFPFPSNKISMGSTVFFRWIGDDFLYGYGKVEEVIPNDRTNGKFPLDGSWKDKKYPYIVKFQAGSVRVNENGVPPSIWVKEIGLSRIPMKVSYKKLDDNQVTTLLKLSE